MSLSSRFLRHAWVPAAAAATGVYVAWEYVEFCRTVQESGAVEKQLPTVEEAQRTQVVAVPAVVKKREIETLLAWHEEAGHELGSAGRNSTNGAAAYRTGVWETTYLHTAGNFHTRFPDMLDRLRAAAIGADAATGAPLLSEHGGAIDGSTLRPRTIELHTVKAGGSLPYPLHHDRGSCLTIDVLLAQPDDFSGGDFTTLETDGASRVHAFQRAGDAFVFQSHKPHSVQPVTGGTRRVLVVEFWQGEARVCAHRCERHFGPCHHSSWACFWRRALADLASGDDIALS